MPTLDPSKPESQSPSLADVADLTLHHAQGRIVMATFRNFTVVVWGAQAKLPEVRDFGKMSSLLFRTHSKVSSVQIILDNVPMPTEEARDALVRMTEIGAPNLACVANVLTGGGFWASTMRSFLTNVHYVKQRPFVPRIFPTLEEACSEIPLIHTPRTGVHVTAGELDSVFNGLRARALDC